LLTIAAVAALATACDRADDGEMKKRQEEILDRLDSLSSENRETQAKLERVGELEKKLDHLNAELAEMERTIKTAPAAAQPTTQRKRRPEPNPMDVYAVPVDGDPFVGKADALVTIVKGYEYACPFCDKVRPTLEQLRKDYGDDVRIVYKQFIVHPQVATLPAQAVCAAHKQGKFEAYDELVWEKAYRANRDFSEANLEALAREAGLDVARWKADRDGSCKESIQEDHRELQAVGQGATPTFFINGRYMSGAQQITAFKKIIDEELVKAKERLATGTRRRDYYQTWVVDKGLAKFTPPPTPP
jgi:protein-disulfide isomerase